MCLTINHKNSIAPCINTRKSIPIRRMSRFFLLKGDSEMSKKGETGEQDRGKPQPRKKKDRETKRKDKKSARRERQKSR